MTERFDHMPMSNMTYAEVIAYERVLVEKEKARAIAKVAFVLDRIPPQLAAIARKIR